MRILGEKIIIHRGETFGITITPRTPEGDPYVPSADDANPYVLIQLTSTRYSQDERLNKRYWLSQADTLKFASTEIIPQPESTSGLTAQQNVYYIVNSDGNREYSYYNGSSFVDYDFSVTYNFSSIDTSKWIDQRYTYEVMYVSGQSTLSYLQDLYKSYYPDETNIPTIPVELWKAICKHNPCFSNFNYNAPICNFARKDILQKPNLFIVQANA